MFESYPFGETELASDRWNKIKLWLTINLPYDATFELTKTTSDATPGVRSFTEYRLNFSRVGYTDYEADAGLVLRGPTLILIDLMSHFRFGVPTIPTFFDYVREVPSQRELPTPLPAQPLNPIGGETLTGSGIFGVVAGDSRKHGEIFVANDGKRYRKQIKLTPFGEQPSYHLI